MTQYGTLRAWAFIATLVGVFGMIAAFDRRDRLGLRGRRVLADDRRASDRPCPSRCSSPRCRSRSRRHACDRRRRRHRRRAVTRRRAGGERERRSPAHPRGRRGRRGTAADHGGAPALRARLPGDCGPSTEAALAQLEALRERTPRSRSSRRPRHAGAEGRGRSSSAYTTSSAREAGAPYPVGRLGRTRTRRTRSATAMALGHIDYYALKPWSTPDELFHRLVSEFLQEWRRQNAPGRRELTVVADPWSPRGYELRNLLARNGVPHAFHTL